MMTPAADSASLPPPSQETSPAKWSFSASRQFTSWLGEQKLSIGATTYQAGKLLLIGLTEDERITVLQRNFPRCMGLWTNGQTMLVSTLYQILRFENTLPAGQSRGDFDRLFVPRITHVTGDLDVHDIAVDGDGRIVFVNTLFGCLSTVSARYSFAPLWHPPFVSRIAAEDRCHLNGMAMDAGAPRYVTAVSESDMADGWRDHRQDGGVVVDVESNEIVCRGLSMPHSPRLHRGRLWLLDSGTGRFGSVDPATGTFTELTLCPGFARGLSFHGNFAIVGLSMPRAGRLAGLALEDALKARKASPRCGLIVIDLDTGDIVHWLSFEGAITELYDIAILPGVRRPGALGFETNEICRAITVAPHQPPSP